MTNVGKQKGILYIYPDNAAAIKFLECEVTEWPTAENHLTLECTFLEPGIAERQVMRTRMPWLYCEKVRDLKIH